MRATLALAAALLMIATSAMAQSSTSISAFDNPNAVRASGIGPSDGPLGITGASSDPNAGYNVTLRTIEANGVVHYDTPVTPVPGIQYVPYGGRW
jgi:hypothetical protein